MQIVAQERLFDLQAVKNDADNSSITGIFIHTFILISFSNEDAHESV